MKHNVMKAEILSVSRDGGEANRKAGFGRREQSDKVDRRRGIGWC